VAARVRATGRLSDVDDSEFLLLLLMAGMLPFGLPALTERVLGHPLSPQRHAHVLLEALLGPVAGAGVPASGLRDGGRRPREP
jgi:hypothetical protein